MPTTYAHWRFGNTCIPTLDQDLQTMIRSNREVFDYGVHGPDIFFYYHCLKANEINEYGNQLHDASYKSLLEQFAQNYSPVMDKTAYLSYVLGFTCHFVLDSYCHGYIERKDETSTASHGKIESQFDRYLLVKDGYDPIKTSVTTSLKPSKSVANTIAECFPNIGQKVIYQTIKDQRMYLNLLKDSSDIKRFVLGHAMDLVGVSSFKDLFLTKSEDPVCKDSNLRLDKYFEMASKHYPVLAQNVVNYLVHGEPLMDYFKHTFGPKADYQTIPVYSYQEEQGYSVNELQK